MRSFRKKQGAGGGEGPLRWLSAPCVVADASQGQQDGLGAGRGDRSSMFLRGSPWEHTQPVSLPLTQQGTPGSLRSPGRTPSVSFIFCVPHFEPSLIS